MLTAETLREAIGFREEEIRMTNGDNLTAGVGRGGDELGVRSWELGVKNENATAQEVMIFAIKEEEKGHKIMLEDEYEEQFLKEN